MINFGKLEKLSANTLKIIALILMTLDHIGLFFGNILILRLLGRIAFPIFAFFISEGCFYTKNKTKHLLIILFFAVIYQIVYYYLYQKIYISIFGTFSVSIILIYVYDLYKNNFDNKKKYLYLLLLVILLMITFIVNIYVLFDYGFIGIITPLCVYIFKSKKYKLVVLFILCIALSAVNIKNNIGTEFEVLGYLSIFNILSIPLLMLYNGKRGKYNLKYFFYFYYPLHIVVIYLIYFLIFS